MNNILRPSFFDFTELVRRVAQHLSQHEIVQCMQVSKQFALQFESMLWEHLDFSKKTPPSTEASYRNLLHIRSITINVFNLVENLQFLTYGLHHPAKASHASEPTPREDSTTCTALSIPASDLSMPSLPLCTNLRRIDIGDWDSRCWVDLHMLLRHNLGLQSIVLSALILTARCSDVQLFIDAISNLVCLEDMTLNHSDYRAPIGPTLSFLRTCLKLPRLSRLKMDYHTDWTKSEQQAFTMQIPQILDETLAARRMATEDGVVEHRIREFVLPHILEGVSISSMCAILQSELLELDTFTISQINDSDRQGSLDVLGNAIRQHCTRVQHLVISDRFYEADHRNVDRTVIRECSGGLRSIQATRVNNYACRPSPELTLWTAIRHHSKTLEEIELQDHMAFMSMDIQEALVSCTKLRRFWVESDFYSDVYLDVDDVAQGDDWGCLGMKELALKLRRNEPQSGSVAIGNEEDTRVFVGSQRLYEQIGRLVDLEVLALDCKRGMVSQQIDGYAWDLTLSKGGLRNLSGLKKLRKLSLRADFCSNMSQADVEFIDAEWPQLEEIEFGYEHTVINDVAHWKWLKERRPGIRYVRT